MSFASRILKAMWEETIHPPNSLRLPREQMPQVRSMYMAEYLAYLKKHGVSSSEETVPAKNLKPTQGEINGDKARAFDPNMFPNLRGLCTADDYVLDGHHRWQHGVWNNLSLKMIRIHAPIKKILQLTKGFPHAEYVGLNHYHRPATVPAAQTPPHAAS